MVDKWCYNLNILIIYLWGREDQDKRRQENDYFYFYFYFKNTLFGHTYKQIDTSNIGAWSFLLVHIRFTPSEGPKGFIISSFKKLDHGRWTTISYHEKRPSSRVWFHGPWCKLALSSKIQNFEVRMWQMFSNILCICVSNHQVEITHNNHGMNFVNISVDHVTSFKMKWMYLHTWFIVRSFKWRPQYSPRGIYMDPSQTLTISGHIHVR